METRALINIVDGKDIICTIYRQFDGYIEGGLGEELRNLLKGVTVVNGFSGGMRAPAYANGIGCLAAQLISKLKTGQLGNVYLYAPGTKNVGEEFTYRIGVGASGKPWLTVRDEYEGEEHYLLPESTGRTIGKVKGKTGDYEIKLGADGRAFCTCPAWKFSKSELKTCKHLKAYLAGE